MYRFHRLAWITCLCFTTTAYAQPNPGRQYPDHPIRLIVPFPAGGNADASARTVARQVEAILGQPIVIDNRGGANGIIGCDLAAKAAPDGYTLMHTSSSLIINASVYKSLPYRTDRDFTPITTVARGQGAMLVVHPAVPAQSVKEFIAYARGKPLSFGSPGVGNSLHLMAEAFNLRAGVQTLHVPYKGAAPAVSALVGGELQFMFLPAAIAMPQVNAGRLRALGYSAARRLDSVPSVPTMDEAGLAGFQMDLGWHAWFGPAKLPAAITQKLHDTLRAAIEAPKVREFFVASGYAPVTETPAQFQKTFLDDIKRWGEVVKAAKIEPQ